MVCRVAAVAALGMFGMVGCSETPAPTGHVAFQVTSRSSPDAAASGVGSRLAAADSSVVAYGGDTIVIRRAELVLRNLWLQPAETGECEPEEEEYCAELQNDLVVLTFPLADSAEHRFVAAAKPGAYSGLQLEVYNPAPDREAGFLASHPEFVSTSARFQGTLSRSGRRRDFVATSDLTGIQELALSAPLAVQAGDTTRLTLRVDLARVFLGADRTSLIDPATTAPGGPNAHLLQDNIRMSLRAFRDENRDGLDDESTARAVDSSQAMRQAGESSF